MTFFERLVEILIALPDMLLTGPPEQVIIKVGGVLLALGALFVITIRAPLSKELPPTVGFIMILAGVLFWAAALVIIVTALGTLDLPRFLQSLWG